MPQRRMIGDVASVSVPRDGRRYAAPESTEDRILRELRSAVTGARTPTSVPRPPAGPPELPHAQFAPVPVHPLDAWSRTPSSVPASNGKALWSLVPWVLGAGAVIAGLLMVSQYGLKVKGRVIQQGDAAISHLMEARAELEAFDFDGARSSLERSAEEFDRAGRELNTLGPTVTTLLSKIPGLSALRTGSDILRAGELLSDAGLALSEAVGVTVQSGGVLDPNATDRTSLGSVFLPLQRLLGRAQDDVTEAQRLLQDVDPSSLPEEHRAPFTELQNRLPTIRTLVDRAVDTVAFLSRMMGIDGPRRYLVLFSNPSELRPTGGFPGSYGLLTFENGRMKDFRADDIYNPDGQITELIVPPRQLQHITPGWGMRDAAWWADFPTSARKVMEFWRRSGNTAVDGVLTVKPDMLEGILAITGPVPMPAYGLTLTSENVVQTLQLEVESQKTEQPKQIIVDLAPLILDRLSSAPTAQWILLLELFTRGLEQKDVLMYFDDDDLQSYIRDAGFDGSLRETGGDYLMVNISNIKGAKTDAVTDTTAKLEGWMQDGTMIHRLTLTRRHNGGGTEYGFYNKPNYSWVRVLVPEGSALRGIVGNATPSVTPLLDYTKVSAERDPDLEALESTYRDSGRGAVTFGESGKTGFGFWMTVEPNGTSSVQLEYSVPARFISEDYTLVVQRQPGLSYTDFELTIQKGGSLRVTAAEPPMTEWPDSWRLHTPLERDLELRATFR